MLTTKRELEAMLSKVVDDDAPIMLKLKGESVEFPLDVEENYILNGALHLQLGQAIQDVADEGLEVRHNYIEDDDDHKAYLLESAALHQAILLHSER